jgi:hypothetical protein
MTSDTHRDVIIDRYSQLARTAMPRSSQAR